MDSTRSEKACFKCGLIKPLGEFYRHPQMGDGHLNKCKECTKLDVAQNRRRRLDYYLAYDQRRYRENQARRAFLIGSRNRLPEWKQKFYAKYERAIKSGKLVRPDRCEDCGKKADRIEGHHEDYDKPLQVAWLCPLCHGKRHRTVVLPPHMEVEEPVT